MKYLKTADGRIVQYGEQTDSEYEKRELIDFVSNILYPEVKKCELAVYYYK